MTAALSLSAQTASRYNRKMERKTELKHLVFELTEACNQNCRFCYNHWRPDGFQPVDKKQTARTLKSILSQAKVGSISFSGGEPTLLTNMLDLALRCRFNGAALNILTNGTIIREEDIRNLRNIGISNLQVPLLSSDPSIHETLTGLPGSWEKSCTTIRRAVDILGSDKVAIVLIITAMNAETIKETLEFYKSLGVRTVMVNRFNLGGNGLSHREELCLSREGLHKAFRAVSDFAVANHDFNFVSGVCTPVCLMDPKDFPGIQFTTCSTDLDTRPITISYKGDVRFCNHSPFVMGNIFERPLKDILEDENVKARYSGVPEQCADCKLFFRCKGGCRAAAEQVYGNFKSVDPIIETI